MLCCHRPALCHPRQLNKGCHLVIKLECVRYVFFSQKCPHTWQTKKKQPPKNSTPRKTIKKEGKQKIFEGLLCARHQGKKKVQHSFHSPKARTRGVAEPSQGQGKVTENVAYFKCFTFNKSMSLRGKKNPKHYIYTRHKIIIFLISKCTPGHVVWQ